MRARAYHIEPGRKRLVGYASFGPATLLFNFIVQLGIFETTLNPVAEHW